MRRWDQLERWEREERLSDAGARFAERPSDALHKVLCARCKEGVVMMRRDGKVSAFCRLLGACGESGVVPLDLVECSSFDPRIKIQPLDEMARNAISIDPRPDAGGQYL